MFGQLFRVAYFLQRCSHLILMFVLLMLLSQLELSFRFLQYLSHSLNSLLSVVPGCCMEPCVLLSISLRDVLGVSTHFVLEMLMCAFHCSVERLLLVLHFSLKVRHLRLHRLARGVQRRDALARGDRLGSHPPFRGRARIWPSDAQKKLASFRNWRLRISSRGPFRRAHGQPTAAMSGFVAELRDNAEAFVRRRKIDALCTDEDKVAPGTRPSPNSRG